jgi:hypothetical protein
VSRVLIAFVTGVTAAAAASLLFLPSDGLGEEAPTAVLLATMTALIATRPVRIPALRINMTATHPFALCALVAVGPVGAVLANVAGVIGAAVGRGRYRPLPIHFVFNLGSVVVCTAAAWWTYAAAGGQLGDTLRHTIWPLFAASVVYFLLSTGLVAAAIALERKQSFFRTWRHSCLWTILPFFAGLPLTVAMLALIDATLTFIVVLAIPFSWLLVMFYREQARELDED